MIETLLGGVFGGLLRLAPEAFKLFAILIMGVVAFAG